MPVHESDQAEARQWWLSLARRMLDEHGYHGAEVTWLAHTHNVVLDVYCQGSHFVLRLHQSEEARRRRLQSELEWLRAICQHTTLSVPEPAAHMTAVADGQRIDGVLFHHLPGQSPAPDAVTGEQMRRLGAFLARLHRFSRQFVPSPAFDRPRLDAEGLFGPQGIYHPGPGEDVFTAAQRQVMAAAADRAAAAMAELGTGEAVFGMIHGDLLLKNVLFHRGQVQALDFEYCGWGYFLYDLAPALWQLKTVPRYPRLAQAMWDGYTAVQALPERQRELLEAFLAARQVASMRWLAGNLDHPAVQGQAEALIAQRTAELQAFLQTGVLRRESATL